MLYLSLKIVNKHNVCISPKYQGINFFEDETTLISLGAGEERYFHSKESFSWFKVTNPTLILRQEKFKETSWVAFSIDLIKLMRF